VLLHGAGLTAALLAAAAAPAAELAGVPVAGFAWATIDAAGPAADAKGAAELAPDGRIVRPLTPETPVRIASVSKIVVALAILRLADAGRIDLDAEASRYLGFPFRNPHHAHVPVTVRQLVRHHSSLSDAGGYSALLGERLAPSLGPSNWSAAAPGTRFDYANLNSVVLATIVEVQTGERWDRAAQSLVLRPLGIRACFNWSECAQGYAATGATLYRKSADFGETWDPAGPWVPQVDGERPPGNCPVRRREGGPCDLENYHPGTHGGLFAPQGGLRISAVELARLGAALLANRGDFLKPATHAALFRAEPVAPAGDGGETDPKLMRFWSEGGLHCFSGTGEGGTDQPQAPRPLAGCGHLGEAYGLYSGLVMDPATGRTTAWFLTGTAAKPPPGRRSHFNAVEEALIDRALP
jgi:CubicO group peptidase (beta-lactamase class C family)